MPTNFYFQSGDTSGTTSEQLLVEDLVIESLKIYGHDVYYLPRTFVNRDTIFDEDSLSKFTQAYPLEMYRENVAGYEGDGELFSRFGLETRDQATFILARRRWDELVVSTGGTFVQDGTRPMEGDLLYFGKTRSLFEIKFVEFQNPFYQLGKIYTFRITAELFEYSSEEITTGIGTIDQVEDDNSLAISSALFLFFSIILILISSKFSSSILAKFKPILPPPIIKIFFATFSS